MTASTRRLVLMLAPCLVIAAAMQPAAQRVSPGAPPAQGLAVWSPREVFESSIDLSFEVVGTAVPTDAERADGYVAIEHVVAGDAPGEWVATTPHAAHWFDAAWRQGEVTDLRRRFRSVHPVRFSPQAPVALVAEQGNIDRLIEFDRAGREVRRHEVPSSAPPAFGDFDGDGTVEIASVSRKSVVFRSREGTTRSTVPFDTVVTELDAIRSPSSGKDLLLAYRSVLRGRGTRLEVVSAGGEVLHAWTDDDASRYSVIDWDSGPMLAAHLYGSLRLRDVTGRLRATRESGYRLRTRDARAIRLDSGHEVFLLSNRHYATSALLIYDRDGRRVHREHPGGFARTLWTMPGDRHTFYLAVGPDIRRYRLGP